MPSGDDDTDNDDDVVGVAGDAIFGIRGEASGFSDDGAVTDE